MPGISRFDCSFLPSRYQEGLKKTKELQDLKEEEEEQKSESPEEPEEAEETEEEERDPRSRLELWPLLKWVTIHLTAQHLWRCQSKGISGSKAQMSSQQKPRGTRVGGGGRGNPKEPK